MDRKFACKETNKYNIMLSRQEHSELVAVIRRKSILSVKILCPLQRTAPKHWPRNDQTCL